MREMRDSGVEWLGELPAEWELSRLGTLYATRNCKVSDEDYAPLSVTMGGIVPQLSHVAKSDDHANRKLVQKGDFVINSRSDRRNSCGFAPSDGSVSLINTVCIPRSGFDSRYFGYLFDSEQWADEFYSWGHGIVADLWTTSWNEMKRIMLPVPPLDEQRCIADYLDAKCAEIDRAIEAAEKSIEEYESYRRSLVTYGTACKRTSKRVRLRNLCSRIFDGPFGSHLKSADYIDEGIRVIRLENLKYMRFDDSKQSFISHEKYKTISRHTVTPDDLIMATFVAKEVQVVELPSYVEFAVNKADCVGLRLNGIACKRFVQYALSSNAVLGYLQGQLHGTTRGRVNTSQIKTIPLALPPLDEQRRIVDYLDEKCVQIDRAIAAKQAIIADLKAYKQSLIYEVVTGKREV